MLALRPICWLRFFECIFLCAEKYVIEFVESDLHAFATQRIYLAGVVPMVFHKHSNMHRAGQCVRGCM